MTIPSTDFGPGDLAPARDRYALLAAVLRSSAARSGFIAAIYRQSLPPGAARDEMGHRINLLDPPDHTRVRKLVAKAFAPRRVAALRPYVVTLCGELLAPHDADAAARNVASSPCTTW